MIGRIAKLYYEYDLTQQQIADIVGWSRIKVTRALAEAREQGLVEITVHSDEAVFREEEAALEERFGLQRAWVGPDATDDGPAGLAKIGSQAVREVVKDGMQVAVGLSETLAAIASVPQHEQHTETVYVPLQGTNPGLVTPPTPSNIASEFAAGYGGRAHALAAPVVASTPAMYELLSEDAAVMEAFETARRSDLALVGIGPLAQRGSIILRGDVGADLDLLRANGAVGDINARYYDDEGRLVSTDLTQLVLGLTLEEFRTIPIRIAAAAGSQKVAAILGALHGGFVNGLVTDLPTADALLRTE